MMLLLVVVMRLEEEFPCDSIESLPGHWAEGAVSVVRESARDDFANAQSNHRERWCNK